MDTQPSPATDAAARAVLASLDADATRHDVPSAGTLTCWRSWGAGPPLVLLHGGSGSWRHWVHNIRELSRHRRVLAADLPGLGDSQLPAPGYSAESLGEMVATGIDQLLAAGEPCDLVGFSFGGIIGGHVAALERERVRSLTIVGSPVFGMGSTGPVNEVLAVDPALDLPEAASLHRHNLALFMLADAGHVDALALRVHHDNLRQARLRSRKIARTDTLLQALRRTDCRLHGIWGSADVTVHPSMAALREALLAQDPLASFDVIEGAGHWVTFEAPQAFNGLLRERLG